MLASVESQGGTASAANEGAQTRLKDAEEALRRLQTAIVAGIDSGGGQGSHQRSASSTRGGARGAGLRRGHGDHNGAGGGDNGLGDGANTGGQVTKVPVGSVDTGDGSTTTGTGVVFYLVVGGLMLVGAGAGATRRLRRDS